MLTAAMTSTPTRRVGSFGLLIPAPRGGPRRPRRYDRAVTPLVLALAGAALVAGGLAALRRLGPGFRVGRLLAATPQVTVAEARAIAAAGAPRYVAVRGRIDAEDEFEDEHGAPLVLRRRRVEVAAGGGWRTLEDERRVVPFTIQEGLDAIGVAGDALDEGLVVIGREAEGRAGEVPDRVPAGTDPGAAVRLRVEQVSAVEHALVLGMPVEDPVRGPLLAPGLGRPLVLTTLETPEALRLLGGGRQGPAALGGLAAGSGLGLLAVAVLWALADALA